MTALNDRHYAPAEDAEHTLCEAEHASGSARPSATSHAFSFNLPIRSLGPAYRERIALHLLQLTPADRYLRFGYAAGDEQIRRYAKQLSFERDDIFGIHNRKLELIAMAHLAYSQEPEQTQSAEFAVSVLAHARGRGYGTRMFERAAIHARNEGVNTLFIHALSENTAMLNIARSAGAVVRRDGPESQAFLELPAATFDSHMSELAQQQYASFDYQLKKQTRQLSAFLSGLQAGRDRGAKPDHKPEP